MFLYIFLHTPPLSILVYLDFSFFPLIFDLFDTRVFDSHFRAGKNIGMGLLYILIKHVFLFGC